MGHSLITFTIPLPPSVNAAFTSRAGGSHLIAKTAAYWWWLSQVKDRAERGNFSALGKMAKGRYGLWLRVPVNMRGDIDNRVKLVSDVLREPQTTSKYDPRNFTLSLVQDDKLMDALYVERAYGVEDGMCKVTIVALSEWRAYLAMMLT